MTERMLHFALGPVQGFIAQARRTRDLWAGSYLLSYLAGRAIHALEKTCGDDTGTVIFPDVTNDPLMRVLRGLASTSERVVAAEVASLPNRFKARVGAGVNGQVCVTAIGDAWSEISDAVLTALGLSGLSQVIWEQQIARTWDCHWVIGDDSDLDRRKNLRTHVPAVEEGEKCTMCGERQELSGSKGGSRAFVRKSVKDWWDEKRNLSGISDLDLRDGERLCAVCVTKRLFPHFAKDAIGLALPQGFPSTPHMAALPWINFTLKEASTDVEIREGVEAFVQAALVAGVNRPERIPTGTPLETAARSSGLGAAAWDFAKLDGGMFFRDTVANESEFLPNLDEESRKRLLDALKRLQRTATVGSASAFYAILAMDGDGMGRLLRTHPEHQHEIAEALTTFSSGAARAVREVDGRLVYAGGDDVLALLPLDTALDCAIACRGAYVDAFRTRAPFVPADRATISAGVVYAHMHTPLGVAILDAHRLLDHVAKEQAGKDAIAFRVWKRGGPILTWASPWSHLLRPKKGSPGHTLIHDILSGFDTRGEFSSKFFYRLRDLFAMLNGDDAHVASVLTAEYLGTRGLTWPEGYSTQPQRTEEAERRVKRLLALCRTQRRQMSGDTASLVPAELRDDAALLVRFLSQKEA